MKVTNFRPGGLPIALAGWSSGVTSINSNATTTDGGLSALNFVQRITANGSNVLLNPSVNFAAGSNIWLSLDSGPGGSIPSNTIRIHSTGTAFDFWFNVEEYGAVHDGATDDTVAVQAAITACMAAGGGTVFFPNGIYAINGALQSTSTYNSQLTIPQNPLTGGLTQPPISIRFLGMGSTAQSNNGAIGDWLPSESGAILLSSWNGTITDSPAVIAAGKVDALYPAASFNWVQVTFESIEIRTHANPKLSAIQMRAAVSLSCLHVTVSTDEANDAMALPSNTNAIGIDMPLGLNSNPPDLLDDVFVSGYYTGIRTSEQANGTSISFGHCTRAMQFTGGVGSPNYIRHANHFGKILAWACPRVLVFDTDERWVYIDLLNIEHDADAFATFAEVYDIDDASNYARGFIGWHVTDYTNGPEDGLLVNGATGLSLHGAYAKRWKLNSVVHIPTGTNPSTNPATGRFLYAASADGHLTVRKTDGTTVDLETSGGSVATDTIWDAAGDLAVGSGADTAARLAIGAVGGHVSRINGVVAWDSGTSNPGAAAAGDRYWRSDLGLAIYYDGTRWLTVQHLREPLAGGSWQNISGSPNTFGYLPMWHTTFDLYVTTVYATTYVVTTNTGSAYWTCDVRKNDSAASPTSLGTFNTSADSPDTYTTHTIAVNAVVAQGTNKVIDGIVTKTSTPGNIYVYVSVGYRLVVA